MTIPELRALLSRATPGPWRVIGGHLVELPLCNAKYPDGNIRWCPSLTYEHKDTEAPNAALIAAAVNALPLLLDAVEAAQRVIPDGVDDCWRLSDEGHEVLAAFDAAVARLNGG